MTVLQRNTIELDKQLTLRKPSDTHAQIKLLAAVANQSVNQFVLDVLENTTTQAARGNPSISNLFNELQQEV